jgi:type II secretory pathway component PulJ
MSQPLMRCHSERSCHSEGSCHSERSEESRSSSRWEILRCAQDDANAADSRAGFTVTELMVAVTFFSLLIVMATRLVSVMYGSERAARKAMVSAIALDRLAHQFQRDVRAADKVIEIRQAPGGGGTPPPGIPQPQRALLLRRQPGGELIEYAETGGIVTRNVVAEPADAGPQVSREREQFRLSAASRLEMTLHRGTSRKVVGMTIWEGGVNADRARLTVQAVLGGDWRFADRTTEER